MILSTIKSIALLEQRNEVVERVAAVKRGTGFRIRDFTRERELLANRGEHAESAGLRKEVIESLFRVILWASRDKQAVLNAEVPVDVEKKNHRNHLVVHGGMGSVMASMFQGFGHHVVISDLNTEITNTEAASQSDVIVISVPIETTIQVIKEIGPHLQRKCSLDGCYFHENRPCRSDVHSFDLQCHRHPPALWTKRTFTSRSTDCTCL